jgi:hypothetical protein
MLARGIARYCYELAPAMAFAKSMSDIGTFRTSRDVRLESATRAKADIGPGDREARR